jgi:hypothetical protein
MSIDALEPEKNYPVNDFKYQENMFDAVIGYQKGGFIYYEIMKLIGKDSFFDALKNFSKEFRGKRAYWSDLIDEFTKAAPFEIVKKYDLSEIINKWLKSKEIPEVRLLSANKSGNELQLQITKSTDLTISLPVKLIGKDKSEVQNFVVSENKLTLKLPTNFDVEKVQIDPDYQVLRKIYSWEKPFSYGRTLSSNPLVVLPADTSKNYPVAKEFYEEMVKSGYNFKSRIATELTPEEISSNSLILLGNITDYKLLKDLASNLPKGIVLDDAGFKYNGKSSNPNEVFLMVNSDHPNKSDLYATAIIFDGLTDMTPLKRLFHYQSYSLVLLSVSKPGRPLFDSEIFPRSASKFELQRNLD